MTSDKLPARVEEFIFRYISSIEQLEILGLLLAEPVAEWAVKDIYKKVLSSTHTVETHLRFFKAEGLVDESKTEPATFRSLLAGEVKSAAEQTLQCYKEMPVRVIHLIYVRKPSGPQGFADAFIFKRTD